MSRQPSIAPRRLRRCSAALTVIMLCGLTYAGPGFAHVALDTPKSGLTLAVGSTVVITWEDTILHEGIGYDLDLVGADQQLQSPIVHELPTRLHRYDWLVPDISCVACYVMVTQVNRGQDYNDSALVNIYGKPAAGGSGGSGGSFDLQGGAGRLLAGGTGGRAGQHAFAGAAGNIAVSSAGSGGASGAADSPNGSVGTGSTAGSAGEAALGPMAGEPAVARGGSSGASDAAAGEPDGAADDAAGEPDGAAAGGSRNAGGCAIDGRQSRPRFGLGLAVAILSLVLASRKRRAVRHA